MLGVDVCPYEVLSHIPEYRPFRMQTKHFHVIIHTLFPNLPIPPLTSRPCRLHLTTDPIIHIPTLQMPKPPQSAMPHRHTLYTQKTVQICTPRRLYKSTLWMRITGMRTTIEITLNSILHDVSTNVIAVQWLVSLRAHDNRLTIDAEMSREDWRVLDPNGLAFNLQIFLTVNLSETSTKFKSFHNLFECND